MKPSDMAFTQPQVSHLLDHHSKDKWQNMNLKSYMFHHNLADHPLFTIPRLVKLAELAIEKNVDERYYSDNSEKLNHQEWRRSLPERIAELQEGNHWLKVSAADRVDPEYNELLQSLLTEVETLTNVPIRKFAEWSSLTVFMNSPHLAVPYHIDHDTNFLLQVRGEKDVYLFDPTDRSVLTLPEIEDFYQGNAMAGRYRDDLMKYATCYHLTPGLGVHHPPLAPHMIRNGNEISVSISIFFDLPENNYRARVYQCNYLMRKLGLNPTIPGQSAFSDWAKSNFIRAFAKSNPSTWDEMLYSGISRIRQLSVLAKRRS